MTRANERTRLRWFVAIIYCIAPGVKFPVNRFGPVKLNIMNSRREFKESVFRKYEF